MVRELCEQDSGFCCRAPCEAAFSSFETGEERVCGWRHGDSGSLVYRTQSNSLACPVEPACGAILNLDRLEWRSPTGRELSEGTRTRESSFWFTSLSGWRPEGASTVHRRFGLLERRGVHWWCRE